MVSVPASDAPARGPIQVGEWTVDPATNELRRGDEATRIEPKSMDVLRFLADRAGRVVTREELFEAAWPGMVVGDEALSQAITKLRRALGDDPRSPRYIETISKRGYRLTAPVVRDAEAGSQAARASVPMWLGATAIVLLLLAAAGWFLLAPAPAPAGGEETADREEAWTTVSVTPFEWIGGDASQAYLARAA
jgi:transcriptional activator of cad operon